MPFLALIDWTTTEDFNVQCPRGMQSYDNNQRFFGKGGLISN